MGGETCVKGLGSRIKPKACVEEIKRAVKSGRLPQVLLDSGDGKKTHADELCEGAVKGRDIDGFGSIESWLRWLEFSVVQLDERDYLIAAVHALRLAPRFAATDYGTARMRDLGQLWTDAIRGFLGELAFAKWLKTRFDASIELDYEKKSLEEALPTDVKCVNGKRPPFGVSIKTTKLGGVWLDVPYRQLERSRVFILVRVGVTRYHFVSFLKVISVIRDKLLQLAVGGNLIGKTEAEEIWKSIPDFKPVIAYIAGFVDKQDYSNVEDDKESIILVEGKLTQKKFAIYKYLGWWHPDLSDKIKILCEIPQSVKIEFEGIKEFTRTWHFLASSGVLKKSEKAWEQLISELERGTDTC